MSRDYITIGPCPAEENAVQVGCDNYSYLAQEQCRKYLKRIREMLGPEPEGAQLQIKSFPHDFGSYYEVVCYYDPNNEESVDYAFKCEAESPVTW